MRCPCKGCEKRHEACHDHCERYQAWSKPMRDSYPARKDAALGALECTRKAVWNFPAGRKEKH